MLVNQVLWYAVFSFWRSGSGLLSILLPPVKAFGGGWGWGRPSSTKENTPSPGCSLTVGLVFRPSTDNLPRLALDDPTAAVTDIESFPSCHRFDLRSIGVTGSETLKLRFVPAYTNPGFFVARFMSDSFFCLHSL